MKKVITYGTFDLLHEGHINLLKNARKLGDYLIVGVTSDAFDKGRGKINVKESLIERIENVKKTGLADKIIVEEYEGQKIDDILKYGIDVFTVGSDWVGTFDYLNEYCHVEYLPRTAGISSSQIRITKNNLKLGVISNFPTIKKFISESKFVNGLKISNAYTETESLKAYFKENDIYINDKFETLIDSVDAVYISSHPNRHFEQIKYAILKKKSVLCDSPIALTESECKYLFKLADDNNVFLIEANKTAYSTAYNRLLLLAKSGKIGDIVSVNSVCTSLADNLDNENNVEKVNSISSWGIVSFLPILQLLNPNFKKITFYTYSSPKETTFDLFTKIDFLYDNGVGNAQFGQGVKSEGSLVISGTKGYIYVPSPWWKTEYFEIKYENQNENKKYFYQLDGEGIRLEIVDFVQSIKQGRNFSRITREISIAESRIFEKFYKEEDVYFFNSAAKTKF